jgi:putative oxidoreductase
MNKENTTEVSTFNGLVSLGGRIALGTIFLMSAVGNKIPNFSGVASYMSS